MEKIIPLLVHLQPPARFTRILLVRFSPYFVNPAEMGVINIQPSIGYRYAYRFTDGTLHNLAYYFDYDYSDGRDPTTYTLGLGRMIKEWKDNHSPGLLKSNTEKKKLIITDNRWGGGRMLEKWPHESHKACYDKIVVSLMFYCFVSVH